MIALLASLLLLGAQDTYTLGPDSQRHADVPRGAVVSHTWSTSKIYPGTARNYWVYVPQQYKPGKASCLMVFQDGAGMVSDTGAWRVPIVFDNLIARGEMPVTIGIFIDPGVTGGRFNRSYEYDALGDRYARFLIDEIIPEVANQFNVSSDPDDRAVAGSSSGGIAAFNAAWTRPDAFRRVMSFIGSFTNLRGGDTLASLIRKTEPKPLRVFLQDGSKDQDIYSGNWYLGNQEIFASLQYAGYESTFTVGTEAHNGKHGGAILPDALRWLWKDYPKQVAKPERVVDRGVYTILEPGKDWELLGEGYHLSGESTVDREGNVFFTNNDKNSIMKIDVTGKISVWNSDSGKAHGVTYGPDGRLYAGQHDRKRIVAFSPDGKETVLAENIQTHHLTANARSDIYFADGPNHRVWLMPAGGQPRVVTTEVEFPRGVRLSTDQSLLVVTDVQSRVVWSFQIQSDGSLVNGQPFYHLEVPDEASTPDSSGLAFDTEGFLYVGTNMGIQVCDQPGRVTTIINSPSRDGVGAVLFGGADMQWLYATDGNRIYRRHVKRRGAAVWNPVKPPPPRL